MSGREKELMKKLRSMFRIEAEERLLAMSSGLVELESSPEAEKEAVIETLFREAHSLKGASRAVNLTGIELICQSLESAFAAIKQKEAVLTPVVFDMLHRALDTVKKMLSSDGEGEAGVSEIISMLDRLPLSEAGGPGEDHRPAEQPPGGDNVQPPHWESPVPDHSAGRTSRAVQDKPFQWDTVRISSTKLDTLLLQAEEMLSVKLASAQRAADLGEIRSKLELWEKEWVKVYPVFRAARQLMERGAGNTGRGRAGAQAAKLYEFLEWNHSFVKQVQGRVKSLAKSAGDDCRWFGATVDSFLENMKKTVMLPFSMVLESFPKMVRDLSRDQGKEVELVLQGTGVEADKRILEEMKDPLIHLVRNCIDHGIEKPGIRQKNNKPLHGTITLSIAQVSGGRIEIAISDDGAGIDPDRVKEAAVRLGILNEERAGGMDASEAVSLIFQPEVSTSSAVTIISGRGLGMAIVREKVEKLGGTISVDTEPGAGSVFRMILPVTVATFRGITVRVADRLFVIPTANVERVVRVKQDGIKTVENRETLLLSGHPVAFARLGDILGIPQKGWGSGGQGFIRALVVKAAGKVVAFAVDEVLDEQEVLVKGLGKQLIRVRNISGATVLGSGRVVPVLNAHDLIKSAAGDPVISGAPAVMAGESGARRNSVLVVEDSITSRMLLKNIIESAGFDVKTAVDGVDALTALRTGEFHLVVSDVEMPRMNGFDLTARIRADGKLSQIPVVLVTSLSSGEHRERGIDVGADAYIVKSGFDHTNLLEIINRLI
ncbi:MAG: hybrid sensor histidine kinase/response regulator [Bacillota bacterium]